MPINEGLGQYSELFFLLAAITFTVAFIAFAFDLAKTSKVLKANAETVSARVAEPAMAGAAYSHEGLSGPGDRVSKDSSRAALTADEEMNYSGRRRPTARIAVALTILGFALQVTAVVTRGLAENRAPWGNMYEFCTTGSMLVIAVYLLVLTRKDLRFLGAFVTGLVLIMLMAATVGFPTPVGNLVPALQSYWLWIHVTVAMLASGIFTLTFAMSILQLLQARREATVAAGASSSMRFLRLVPSAQALENLTYRLNAVAFVLWTITLVFGAIWADKAWGRYWGWDTKEVWTFVIWVVFAGYLHARATRGWTGTRAAWLSIVGYLCIVFNFGVVNVFFAGLHSYAGLPS